MTTDYQRAFEQKERELALVLAVDRIRDSYDEDDDPEDMFRALVTLLREHFAADACAFAVLEETSDDLDFLGYSGFTAAEAEALCLEAVASPGVASLTASGWTHVLGVQVILQQYPLGGLVVARATRSFDGGDVELLALAESLIDSAVIQARRMWKLRQRNRELEAIYELDRLRDMTIREMDLIAGFTALLLTHFRADLCLLLLTQENSSDLVLRGVVDEYHLSPIALETIRHNAAAIRIPQMIDAPIGFPQLKLLAAPLIVGGERLGAVVVGRGRSFTVSDHRLLYAMMSQMDSAIAHSRAAHRDD